MRADTNMAFKEWAVVVGALGAGEQILILRKGGIHEPNGQFRVPQREFWLFPTQYHEAENSVIPSKRPALRALATTARSDTVELQYYAVATAIHELTDMEQVKRLQGRHIWSEQILQQRFDSGRLAGLHALLVRVYRLPEPVTCPLLPAYGGCKSWIELAQPPSAEPLAPVLTDAEFTKQCAQLSELLDPHALADL